MTRRTPPVAGGTPRGLARLVRWARRGGLGEAARFLLIGGAGFVTDVGAFSVLRSEAFGLLDTRPLTAKAVSVVLATCVTWLGNRYWTYRHRATGSLGREVVLFGIMNALAAGIALACLAVSHYVLGLTSLLADNVAANGVGLLLGTAFRFVTYRTVVFRDVDDGPDAGPGDLRRADVAPSEDLLVPGGTRERTTEAPGGRAGTARGRTSGRPDVDHVP